MSADQEQVQWARGRDRGERAVGPALTPAGEAGALSDAAAPPRQADLLVDLLGALGRRYAGWVEEGPRAILDGYAGRRPARPPGGREPRRREGDGGLRRHRRARAAAGADRVGGACSALARWCGSAPARAGRLVAVARATGPSIGSDIYLLDELLTDEERDVRDRVRRFCDEEVRPVINDYWERAGVPVPADPRAGAPGDLRRDASGPRLPGAEPAGRGPGGDGARPGRQRRQHLPRGPLRPGDERDRPARLGGAEAALAGAPGPPGDRGGLRAHRARPRLGRRRFADRVRQLGDGYVIDGAKRWIGNATFADVMVVWAATPPATSAPTSWRRGRRASRPG